MTVYWYKYRSKPRGKVLTYVSSNKKLAERRRVLTKMEGLKPTPVYTSFGQGAIIWGHKKGK
jgi:hypothetical protein